MPRKVALGLVFYASAAILVLEIMAGRMLAPYLGVTLETFTGIIGTVLAGIALGAWAGGRLADRRDPAALPGPLFVAGGALTLLSPILIRWIGPVVRAAGPVEIVLASVVGFFLPAFALSAVAPVVVKLQLRDLGRTGQVVGGFSAVSSAGAIFGTFVTGFVLVAAAPSRAIILIVGISLIATGVATWLLFARRPTGRTILGITAIALLGSGVAAAAPSPCQVETAYFCARVEVDAARPTGRALWLDTLRHSYVDLADPTYLEFRYAKLVADVLATLPAGPVRALYVGGGGFTFPRYIDAKRPGSTHVVLELDPALVDLAESELDLRLSPDLRVVEGDARIGIGQTEPGSFDFVLGDAFGGPSVPWHLTTEEFLTAVADRLDDDGLYVMNLIDYPPHRFARAELATVAAVFPHVLVIAPRPYLDGDAGGNFVLVGSKVPIDAGAVTAQTSARGGREATLGGTAAIEWAGDAAALRDDFAPVDQLIGRR